MERKIKVGVIGAGRIGKIHTENIIRYVPGAAVAAVADIYADKMKDWANDFRMGICRRTDNNNFNFIII